MFLSSLIVDEYVSWFPVKPIKVSKLRNKNRLDWLRLKDKASRHLMDRKGSTSDRSWDLFWNHTNRDKITRTWIRTFFKKLYK